MPSCRRQKRALVFCYEESASQVIRNMRSVGVDLAPWVESGRLLIHSTRPTLQGLEQHLVEMHSLVKAFRPALVVVDPISNLTISNTDSALKATLMRLIDFLKEEAITGVFTSLTADGALALADSELGISSLMDTWLLLANIEANGERTRTIQVLKSRGMPHSNQVREVRAQPARGRAGRRLHAGGPGADRLGARRPRVARRGRLGRVDGAKRRKADERRRRSETKKKARRPPRPPSGSSGSTSPARRRSRWPRSTT
jgi:circadian clock protein KaiC